MRVSYSSGQTLVELLVAMVVIMIGLTAAAGMVFSNLRTQEISSDRVIASNLAREGIELVKSIRDSNWLAGDPFNTGLYNGTDYTGVPIWSGAQFQSIDFTATDIDDDTWTVLKTSSAASTTGSLYYQGDGTTGTDTAFKRLLTLQPICSDGSIQIEGATCPVNTTVVGVRTISIVQWERAGITREVSLIDEIYDWR